MAVKCISQIKIPLEPQGLTIEKVEPYLATIFKEFEKNAKQIRSNYDTYCLDHKILGKTRTHDDTDINNIVVVPDLRSMINWKTGYVFGNPIKYAQNETKDTDDIKYLNKYVRSAKQRSVDKEVGTWAYATGVGYYFIEPKSIDFDIETEAPYEIYCRESDTCAKIYSSFGGNKPLFDILYTTYKKIDNNKLVQTVKVFDIYFTNMLYTYEKTTGEWKLVKEESRNLNKPLPLVEKRPNIDGIGIVAMGETLQNAVDALISNGLDNVEDIVNEVWVYYNILLGKTPEEQAEAHRKAKKGGAIQAISSRDGVDPKIDTLTPKLSLAEVRELYSIVNAMLHNTCGVPMEVSDTNSGGTTKQGSEVANGYENAYNIALNDINTFIYADTELLEKIMWICKNTPNNKIDNLSASEIEIKYSLNLTDNILTKSQAFGTFMQYMPPSMALALCRLSNDPEMQGKEIEEYIKQKEVSRETKTNDNNAQAKL